jgi:hypothetical protein
VREGAGSRADPAGAKDWTGSAAGVAWADAVRASYNAQKELGTLDKARRDGGAPQEDLDAETLLIEAKSLVSAYYCCVNTMMMHDRRNADAMPEGGDAGSSAYTVAVAIQQLGEQADDDGEDGMEESAALQNARLNTWIAIRAVLTLVNVTEGAINSSERIGQWYDVREAAERAYRRLDALDDAETFGDAGAHLSSATAVMAGLEAVATAAIAGYEGMADSMFRYES